MSGQKNILSFFKPSTEKRPLSTITGNVNESPAKKCKGENEDDCIKEGGESDVVAKCVTPEQKERMAANQMQARMKLLCKQLQLFIPPSGSRGSERLNLNSENPILKSEFVVKERSRYTIYPPEDKVWTWSNACEFSKVKVVILGQDPYHGPRQAHGLCFSVQPGVPLLLGEMSSSLAFVLAEMLHKRLKLISLVNIFKELKSDIPGFEIPKHGYLIGWARQGVLLLNACLSVRASSANSHKDQGWENLTDSVIKALNEKSSGLVFLLWGAYAEKKSAYVDKKKHHILKTVHPSPLSANRGFFGCKHFSQANELLKSQGKTPINWNDLPIE